MKNEIEQEIQARSLTAPRVTLEDIEANITSEYFFTAPDLLASAFPEVYRQLALFYRQDSLARLQRLQAEHPDYKAVENATNG